MFRGTPCIKTTFIRSALKHLIQKFWNLKNSLFLFNTLEAQTNLYLKDNKNIKQFLKYLNRNKWTVFIGSRCIFWYIIQYVLRISCQKSITLNVPTSELVLQEDQLTVYLSRNWFCKQVSWLYTYLGTGSASSSADCITYLGTGSASRSAECIPT